MAEDFVYLSNYYFNYRRFSGYSDISTSIMTSDKSCNWYIIEL